VLNRKLACYVSLIVVVDDITDIFWLVAIVYMCHGRVSVGKMSHLNGTRR